MIVARLYFSSKASSFIVRDLVVQKKKCPILETMRVRLYVMEAVNRSIQFGIGSSLPAFDLFLSDARARHSLTEIPALFSVSEVVLPVLYART